MYTAPSAPRYDSLDIWRGVACLLVLANHAVTYRIQPGMAIGTTERVYAATAAVTARMWIGVPIFFVISGYCISAAVDSHRRSERSIGNYFGRRFRRIFPPYWTVLAVTALLVGAADVLFDGALSRNGGLLRPWWYSPEQWAGSITLTELWRSHLFGGQKALLLGHAWTLCYEEQFYAVCGLLLVVCPRRFFMGAAVVTLAVLGVAIGAARFGIPVDGFFFDGRWVQFALGVLLYRVLNYGAKRDRWMATVVFTAMIATSLWRWTALLDVDNNAWQEYFVAGAFSVAALLLRPFDRQLTQSMLLKPLRLAGVMCYSLYLVHLPVVNIMRATMQAGGVATGTLSPMVTLVVYGAPAIWFSWMFHEHVEQRFMNAPRVIGSTSKHLAASAFAAR